MIAYLKGKILQLNTDHIILDVSGVGYKVESYAPFRLGLEGNDAEVFVHTWLRERELRLFGFSTYAEQLLFEKLLTVSGVGPKAGMLIVSNYSVGQVLSAIETAAPEALRVKGVGSKTLAKVVIELRGKVDDVKLRGQGSESESAPQQQLVKPNLPVDELTQALISLGFSKQDVDSLADNVDKSQPFADQIRQSLKLLRPM